MSGEKIDDIGITGLQELTQYIPNVTINNGAGTPNLCMARHAQVFKLTWEGGRGKELDCRAL